MEVQQKPEDMGNYIFLEMIDECVLHHVCGIHLFRICLTAWTLVLASNLSCRQFLQVQMACHVQESIRQVQMVIPTQMPQMVSGQQSWFWVKLHTM